MIRFTAEDAEDAEDAEEGSRGYTRCFTLRIKLQLHRADTSVRCTRHRGMESTSRRKR